VDTIKADYVTAPILKSETDPINDDIGYMQKSIKTINANLGLLNNDPD